MPNGEPGELWRHTLERECVPQLLADLRVTSDVFSYSLRVAWRVRSDGINRDLRIRGDASDSIVTQQRSYAGTRALRVLIFDRKTSQHRWTAWYEGAALPAPALRLGDLLQPHPDDYDVSEAAPEAGRRVLELRAPGDTGDALVRVDIDPGGPVRTRMRSEVAGARDIVYGGWTGVADRLLATSWTVDEGSGILWRVTLENVDTTSPLPGDLFRESAIERPF